MSSCLTSSARVPGGSALIYARVSTQRQAERDISIPDQKDQMRKFCGENGLSVVGEYEDAHTGRDLERPGISDLMDYTHENPGRIQFLIVYSLSRLGRDAFECEFVYRKMSRRGIQVISITQPIEDSESGILLRQIYNILDEHTSRETAKHVARSLKRNAREGYWNGGVAPFGFQVVAAGVRGDTVKKKLDIKPSEAEDVRLVTRLYLVGDGSSGPMGIKKIAQWLNKNGHLRRGNRWTTGLVHRALTDRIYMGEREFRKNRKDKEKIVVSVPVITDETTFQLVQDRLRGRRPELIAPRKVGNPMLLTGTAECGSCGGGMILRTGKGGLYRYYTCSNHARKGKSVCGGQSVPMEMLDAVIMEALIGSIFDSGRLRAVAETFSERLASRDTDARRREAGLKRELQEREGAMARLYAGVENGLFDPADEQFRTMFGRARDERAIVQAKLESVSRRQREKLVIDDEKLELFHQFLLNKLSDGPVGFRKLYLRAFVEKVVVVGEAIHIVPKTTGASMQDNG